MGVRDTSQTVSRTPTKRQAGQTCTGLLVFAKCPYWLFLKLLVGAASPIPFEQYLRYWLLVHSERLLKHALGEFLFSFPHWCIKNCQVNVSVMPILSNIKLDIIITNHVPTIRIREGIKLSCFKSIKEKPVVPI